MKYDLVKILRYTVYNEKLGKPCTFSALTCQKGPRECIHTLRRQFSHKISMCNDSLRDFRRNHENVCFLMNYS